MAFNPFKGFRKYQKIWMVIILLLCMVTFVLCTGVGGDLSEILTDRFSRDPSPPMVEIDGSNYRRKDIGDLKAKREVANSFIFRGQELVMQNVVAEKKAIEKEFKKLQEKQREGKPPTKAELANFKKLKERQETLSLIESELNKNTPDSFHFGGGVKFDDLVNHKLKLLEADRLGVRITSDQLWNLVRQELFFHVIQMPSDTLNAALMFVREQHGMEGSPELVRKALEDEFRARIAADAIAKSIRYMMGQEERVPLSPNELWDFHQKNRSEFDIALLPFPVNEFVDQVAAPKQAELRDLFDKYKDERYDPSSVTPGFTTPQEVKIAWVTADPKSPEYVKKAEKTRAAMVDALAMVPPVNFIPGAPIWATLRPTGMNEFVEAGLISGDYANRKERIYKSEAEYSRANFAFEAAMYKVAQQAGKEENWTKEEKEAALKKKPVVFAGESKDKKLTWTQAHSLLFSTWLPGSARMETALTAPLVGPAGIYEIHAKEIKPLLEKAHQKRVKRIPAYVGVMAGTPMTPLAATVNWHVAYEEGETDLYLPEKLVEPELRQRRIEELAGSFAFDTMLEVKDALDAVYKKTLQNNDKEPKRRILPVLTDLIAKYQLKTYIPDLDPSLEDKWYSKYEIDDAEATEPLKKAFKSFISGRANFDVSRFNNMMGLSQQNWVRDNDFSVLFFEGPETLKWANQNWAPRVWPPEIVPKKSKVLRLDDDKEKQQLIPTYLLPQFENSQVFVFWRTDEQPPQRPNSLKDVKDLVTKAWKIQKARKDKVIPAVEKFAEKLQEPNVDVAVELKSKAKELDEEIIELPQFSPLYMVPLGQSRRSYLDIAKLFTSGRTEFEYEELIREKVKYPSEEMGKQLVTLMNWKKPVETGNKEVDRINKVLFNNANKLAKGLAKEAIAGKKIQIMMNRPQTEFLLAVITEEHGQQLGDFIVAYQLAASSQTILDPFVMIAQNEVGKEFDQEVMRQLRVRYEVDVKARPKEIRDFDQESELD